MASTWQIKWLIRGAKERLMHPGLEQGRVKNHAPEIEPASASPHQQNTLLLRHHSGVNFKPGKITKLFSEKEKAKKNVKNQ